MAPRRLGAYRLTRRLGGGGFGEVYLATHPLLGEVALKILRGADQDSVKLFLRESSLVLGHPSVPRVLDHGESEGTFFLVQELVRGRSLADVMEAGPMAEPEALHFATQLADVLAHAHHQGVLHRDIKPPNVMVAEDREIKLLDFGVAGIANLSDPLMAGTPAYIAPELALGQGATESSDLYTLGVLMYEMVSGRLPFQTDDTVGRLMAAIQADPVPLDRVRSDVSEGYRQLVASLLEKEPARRPPTAEALGRRLRRVARGCPDSSAEAALAATLAGEGRIVMLVGAGEGAGSRQARRAGAPCRPGGRGGGPGVGPSPMGACRRRSAPPRGFRPNPVWPT